MKMMLPIIIAVTFSTFASDNKKWISKSDSWAMPIKQSTPAVVHSNPINIPHVKSDPGDLAVVVSENDEENIYWMLKKLRKYEINNEKYISEKEYKTYLRETDSLMVVFTTSDLDTIKKMHDKKNHFNSGFAETIANKLKFHSLLIELVNAMYLDENSKQKLIYHSNSLYRNVGFNVPQLEYALDSLKDGDRFAIEVISDIESELEKQ